MGERLRFAPLSFTFSRMLLRILDLLGVAVFAISGALAAGRKRLDLVGVVVLGLVTAVGGGTIRDLLLGRQPIFWLADPIYIIVITVAALLTVAYTRSRRPPAALLLIADALGLAFFSVAGAQIAERAGVPAISGVILGTVTGAAGGLVRDVLTAEVPIVLRRGNLYATAAIAGTSAYFALLYLGVARLVATAVGIGLVAAVRFASIWWGLRLPVFELTVTQEHEQAVEQQK
jgi:uncharacterized membrane protein YeiH